MLMKSFYSSMFRGRSGIFLYAAVVAAVLAPSTSAPAKNVACKRRGLTINDAVMNITQELKLSGNVDDMKLNVEVRWSISGIKDSDFDGFLVRMRAPNSSDIVVPLDDCQASNTHVWVTTDNESICESDATDIALECRVIGRPLSNISCACDKTSCPVFTKGKFQGIVAQLNRKNPYYSIPKTRKSIRYRVEFDQRYDFGVLPYLRTCGGSEQKVGIKTHNICGEMAATKYSLPPYVAAHKCCLSNASATLPVKLTQGKLEPDFETKTLNLPVWLTVPMSNGRMGNTSISVISAEILNDDQLPVVKDGKDIYPPINENCNLGGRRDKTIYNLLPDKTYVIVVSAAFGEDVTSCGGEGCSVTTNITTDFDPCSQEWDPCGDNATCTVKSVDGESNIPDTECVPNTEQNEDGFESRLLPTAGSKVTDVSLCGSSISNDYCVDVAKCIINSTLDKHCMCLEGMSGDGIAEKYNGTGCSYVCPETNGCVSSAICITKQSALGYKCLCGDAHYGDGLESGTGCSSRSGWEASIAVPVVIVVLLLLIFCVWCFCTGSSKPDPDRD